MEKNKARLGINIDHVATLRKARGEKYPDVGMAAKMALEAGADQITIHLREDRRHIQDGDLPLVKIQTESFAKPLNLELSTEPSMFPLALELRPSWICLVPERREEITTEGGLDLENPQVYERVSEIIKIVGKELKSTQVSLFLDHRPKTLKLAADLAPHAVEIHTGEYARNYLEALDKPGVSFEKDLEDFNRAIEFLTKQGISAHAGHGLTADSLLPLLRHTNFLEYNIGHWVISQAIFSGLFTVVSDLRRLIDAHSKL